MKVLGIDPGFGRMGVAIVEKVEGGREKLLYSTCLVTPKTNLFAERLGYLEVKLDKILKIWQPDAGAIERLFFTTNQKTAMQVAEVRGMVLALLTRKGVGSHEYTPGEIKVAVTGSGRANKGAVAGMVSRLLPGLGKLKFDDEYDAIAVALTHIARARGK